MRGAVLHAPATSASSNATTRTIIHPSDAVIRLTPTRVCGSDLCPYRGIEPVNRPAPMGREYVGVVEEVGRRHHHIRLGPVRLVRRAAL